MDQTQNIEDVDFSTDTDGDLLGYMAMREEDRELATQSWGEFYRRHMRYMFGMLGKSIFGRRRESEEDLKDLVQETFRRAFEKAGTFRDQGVSDPEKLRKLARGWLGAIAANLFRDQLRGEVTSPESLDEAISATAEMSDSARTIPSELAKLFTEALDEALDEREREVLRVTAQYLKPGETFQRLPNGVAKKLAGDLNTTTANVRMIRKRSIEKVRRYVRERQEQRE